MKNRLSIVALPVIAGAALISLAADPSGPKPAESDTVRELRSQVTELRAEVEKLRQRTQILESTVDELKHSHLPSPLNLQVNPGAPATPQMSIPSPRTSRPPTVWGEREVNGWTFYIVPCDDRSR